ncbi:hypothetical protein [Phenylobacterium sp. 58.2.17]|uniref:hypothetical protein n=1 Tax=Phenylobacterium sp. 58.2.17 TaxID=2969306 RepID=UPI0022647480|nr:hypothetical protein [Phenylobacterium sp. 58.2.17]MCX7586531.1 hypothetical protein [Phenylobacterium sp. 58.2.17]
MARIRIEYVRPRHGGDAYGISPDVVQEVALTTGGIVVPAEILTIGAAQELSAAVPPFVAPGGFGGGVFARLTCLDGAVVVSSAAAAPAVTDATGVRLEAGQPPVMLAIQAGYRFAFREAAIPGRLGARFTLLSNASASSPAVHNVPGGTYIWSVQGTLNGATLSLQELGPDGASWIELETMTAPGRKGVVVGDRKSVRVLVTGGAGPVGLNSDIA